MILLADSEGPDQTARMPSLGLRCPHMPEDTFYMARPKYWASRAYTIGETLDQFAQPRIFLYHGPNFGTALFLNLFSVFLQTASYHLRVQQLSELNQTFSFATLFSMKSVLLINLKLLKIAFFFLLNIAESENLSANKYENAKY